MGNRAVITTAPYDENNLGIYVHWNGGRDSVEAFLAAARELGYRSPDGDRSYGLARLTGMLALYFGIASNCSLGIGKCSDLGTDGDNGVYLIDGDWRIVGRRNYSGPEQEGYDSAEMARGIVARVRAADAAPDMLDALESIGTDDNGAAMLDAEGMTSIRALIAKVKGEA